MRLWFLAALSLAPLLNGCDRLQPSRVCSADETVTVVKRLMLQQLVGDTTGIDVDVVTLAFDETVALEFIRFEGQNKETGAIHCRASVTSTRATGKAEISFTRQPDVGAGGFVYSISMPNSPNWYGISEGVVERYQILMKGPPVDEVYEAYGTPYAPPPSPAPEPLPVSAPPEAPNAAEVIEAARARSEPSPPPTPVGRQERIENTGPPPIRPDPPSAARPRRPPAITNPIWVRRPLPYFPQAAADAGLTEGRVMLECDPREDGALLGCRVLSESPGGVGFAAAALDASQQARLSTTSMQDAAPGAKVTFTIVFQQRR